MPVTSVFVMTSDVPGITARFVTAASTGAFVGTALEVANKGLAVFGGFAYRVDISAPGHLPRRLTLVTNSAMPQRVHVDLVPIRQP